MVKNRLLRVFLREVRLLVAAPRYLVLLTLGLVAVMVLFATMTKEGQPRKLPVGVVDRDGSYLSRRICHELEATGGVTVKKVYENHLEARRDMQRGNIFAFYEIPEGTYEKVLQMRGTKIVLYTNSTYLLAGTLSYKEMATLGMLAGGAVQREIMRKKGMGEEEIMGSIQPVAFETHNISNPWINYGIYLMTTLIPAVIAFVALMHTGYAIASERRRRRMRSWMKKGGGCGTTALVGKMLPYTLWYTLLALVANVIMFGPMGFPMEGSWGLMVANTVLLIWGAQCVGVFIASCLPDAPLTMSVCALYSAMSFSLSGFSFPIESMPRFFQGFSWLYPIRHYFLNYTHIAMYGDGLGRCWPQFCALMAFGVLVVLGGWMLEWQMRVDAKERSAARRKEVQA